MTEAQSTAPATTTGTAVADARMAMPIPDSRNAAGTVTAGPSFATRPNRYDDTAVASDPTALTRPIVAVEVTPAPLRT